MTRKEKVKRFIVLIPVIVLISPAILLDLFLGALEWLGFKTRLSRIRFNDFMDRVMDWIYDNYIRRFKYWVKR